MKQKGILGKYFGIFYHPLRHARSILGRPRWRKRIQECCQHHPHRPSNNYRPRFHKLKQRRCNLNIIRRGNGGVSWLGQETGRITVGSKELKCKNIHSLHSPNNHHTLRQTNSSMKTNRNGTQTDYHHDEGSDAGWMITTSKHHQAMKTCEQMYPHCKYTLYHPANECFKLNKNKYKQPSW